MPKASSREPANEHLIFLPAGLGVPRLDRARLIWVPRNLLGPEPQEKSITL